MSAGEICKTCGLPKEICVCEELGREERVLRVSITERRYGKKVTVIEGLADEPEEAEALASDLKHRLATGGSGKDGKIVLQGDRRKEAVRFLEQKGYRVQTAG